MKKLLFPLFICSALVLSSCGITSNLTRNSNVTQTTVELSQKNYNVIGESQGVATATYIIGIGGLSPKALRENAQADMLKNANLTGSQAIINPTIHVKRQVYTPLYMVYTVTAYGQIVEFY